MMSSFVSVPPILYTTAFVLMILPCLLFATFASVGRQDRARRLRSFFNESTAAQEVLSHPTATPEISLGEFFQTEYEEAHQLWRYVWPLTIFHIPYLFGMIYSCIAFGFLIDPQKTGWSQSDSQILPIAAIGAAGFVGSALIVLWHLFWRTMRTDLQPRSFTHFAARLTVAPILAIAVSGGVSIAVQRGSIVLFIAFGCGLLTQAAFRLVEHHWSKTVLTAMGRKDGLDGELPLQNLQGLSRNDELRLWEEGIADSEHLAVERVERLLIFTNYGLERIVDWKDQAFLYVYVGDELPQWQRLHIRGAMDVLGLAPKYYGHEKHQAMCKALAKELKKEQAIIERFIDTIYNDPRVHQLWKYLKDAYPTAIAEPIVPHGVASPAPPVKRDVRARGPAAAKDNVGKIGDLDAR
jgi:hypothetical protein